MKCVQFSTKGWRIELRLHFFLTFEVSNLKPFKLRIYSTSNHCLQILQHTAYIFTAKKIFHFCRTTGICLRADMNSDCPALHRNRYVLIGCKKQLNIPS